MSIENDLRRLNRYGLGKVPNPNEPGNPGPHHIGDPTDPAHGGDPGGDVGDNPYKLDRYWGHPTPNPGGFDIDEALRNDAAAQAHAPPAYLHSPATRALRQANYTPWQANRIIRQTRRGQLTEEAGGFHDPYAEHTYDPTLPTWENGTGFKAGTDPVVGDERPMQSTDPGYYIGSSMTPGHAGYHGDPAAIRQGLEQVAAHRQMRLDRLARRQAARGPR